MTPNTFSLSPSFTFFQSKMNSPLWVHCWRNHHNFCISQLHSNSSLTIKCIFPQTYMDPNLIAWQQNKIVELGWVLSIIRNTLTFKNPCSTSNCPGPSSAGIIFRCFSHITVSLFRESWKISNLKWWEELNEDKVDRFRFSHWIPFEFN